MAMRRVRATGGKPPRLGGGAKAPKVRRVGGVLKKVTGRGAHGTGLGLHGAGRKITSKGYTGKGRYGYGQGQHGKGSGVSPNRIGRATGGTVKVPTGKPPTARPVKSPGHSGGVTTPKPPKATGGKPPVAKKPRRFKRSPGPAPAPPSSTKKPSGPRKSRKINRRK